MISCIYLTGINCAEKRRHVFRTANCLLFFDTTIMTLHYNKECWQRDLLLALSDWSLSYSQSLWRLRWPSHSGTNATEKVELWQRAEVFKFNWFPCCSSLTGTAFDEIGAGEKDDTDLCNIVTPHLAIRSLVVEGPIYAASFSDVHTSSYLMWLFRLLYHPPLIPTSFWSPIRFWIQARISRLTMSPFNADSMQHVRDNILGFTLRKTSLLCYLIPNSKFLIFVVKDGELWSTSLHWSSKTKLKTVFYSNSAELLEAAGSFWRLRRRQYKHVHLITKVLES